MDHLPHLRAEIDSFLAAMDHRTMTRTVPGCPGWTVADLVGHLGQVHRWATGIVRGAGPREARAEPPTTADLPEWFADGADDLIGAVQEAGTDTPCWVFGGTGTTDFWARRQALETAIHRVDLQRALGQDYRIDPRLAADGVDEVVTVLYPRQVGAGRTPPVAAIRLRAHDTGDGWVLGEGAECGSVEGDAQALFLALWHRIGPDDPALQVTAQARASLAAAITP